MTVAEFAERAEISKSFAYRLVEEGRALCRRIGQRGRRGCIRNTEDDLRSLLESVKKEVEG